MLRNLWVIKAYLLSFCNSCLYFYCPKGLGYTENCLSRPISYPVNSFMLCIGKKCIFNYLIEKENAKGKQFHTLLEQAKKWRANSWVDYLVLLNFLQLSQWWRFKARNWTISSFSIHLRAKQIYYIAFYFDDT